MGRNTFTSVDYGASVRARGVTFEGDGRASSTVAKRAQQQAKNDKRLHPSVDPATAPIHRSLIRFEPYGDQYRVTVGCPMHIESTCDVTGSMGENVQIMFGVLPQTYDLISKVLPGYDLQLSLGIFGDTCDEYIMSRPQFEMTADKIVEYCSHLFSSGSGGDFPESPQYSVYGAAYLTDAYINRIGLKGYHFLITDASMHNTLTESNLRRAFGDSVFDEVRNNGHEKVANTLNYRTTVEVFKDMHKIYHAFLLMVDADLRGHYSDYYDDSHMIRIGSTRYLPQIEAAIIGLTEATLEPSELRTFLLANQIPRSETDVLVNQLLKIPFGAQRALEEASGCKIPKKGDIFAHKTDLQPCGFASEDDTDEVINGSSGSWL